MYAKFDEEFCTQHYFVCVRCSQAYSKYINCDLDLCPLTSKINMIHPQGPPYMEAFPKSPHFSLDFPSQSITENMYGTIQLWNGLGNRGKSGEI